MHERIFPRISAATKSKQAWDILQTAYQGMEKVKKTKLKTLRRDFESLDMKESDTIDSFFTQILGVVNQIISHSETLEEERVVERIFRCLSPIFDSIVVAIEESKDLSQISVDEIHASLIFHEHRLNGRMHTSLEHAFKRQVSISHDRGMGRTHFRGRGGNSNRGGRRSSSSSSGRGIIHNSTQNAFQNQPQGQRYDKSSIQCHYCKKFEHYLNGCRKKQYDSKQQSAYFLKENQLKITCS